MPALNLATRPVGPEQQTIYPVTASIQLRGGREALFARRECPRPGDTICMHHSKGPVNPYFLMRL
jgi:hypothetical protein